MGVLRTWVLFVFDCMLILVIVICCAVVQLSVLSCVVVKVLVVAHYINANRAFEQHIHSRLSLMNRMAVFLEESMRYENRFYPLPCVSVLAV